MIPVNTNENEDHENKEITETYIVKIIISRKHRKGGKG
jgi:hypothetical protein